MPEMKHNFTKGKMNLDLDERLVPKGEYKSALNIQVSTSEGSEVGAIESIPSNYPGCNYEGRLGFRNNDNTTNSNKFKRASDARKVSQQFTGYQGDGPFENLEGCGNPIFDGSNTVGSIADEKNNTIFWLVASSSKFSDTFLVPDKTHPLYNQTVEVVNYTDILPLKEEDVSERIDPTVGGGFSEPVTDDRPVEDDFEHANYYNTPSGIVLKDMIMSKGNPWLYAGGPDSGDVYKTIMTSFSEVLTSIMGYCVPIFVDKYGFITRNENTVGQTDIIYLSQEQLEHVTVGMSVSGYTPPGTQWPEGAFDNNTYSFRESSTLTGGNAQAALQYGDEDDNDDGLQTFASCIDPTAINFYGILNGETVFARRRPYDCNGKEEGQDGYGTDPGWDKCCIYDGELGCMDPYANNYNPNATVDDGSCVYYDDPISQQVDQKPVYYVSDTPHTFYNALILDIDYESGKVTLNDFVDLDNTHTLHFYSERVLNFHSKRVITGINIIDNMLFWTDNYSEPKKINIFRSFLGTHPCGNTHTKLVTQNELTHDYPPTVEELPPVREKHITVIRKSPKNQLSLSLDTGRDKNKTYAGLVRISDGSAIDDDILRPIGAYDFSGITSGEGSNYMRIQIAIEASNGQRDFTLSKWKVGSKVVLKEWSDDNVPPTLPINDFRIKGKIVDWVGNKFTSTLSSPAKVAIEVDMVNGNPPIPYKSAALRLYTIDLFDESEKLFEFKFPRFSYRYKYSDGEYSTFAPFTDVAFVPGGYKFDAKLGYNVGMTNRLKSVTLKNFIPNDIPKDVIGVDLLYKEDTSPNVYIIDTIKPGDDILSGETVNKWTANEYTVDSDTIHAVIPSNQLLRHWDNVPRKALAQEVSGNRIIYANYLQNFNLNSGTAYDIFSNNSRLIPTFKHSLINYSNYADQDISQIKSIKSLRNYQLGVVFVDKYGRETPVLTNETGAFKTNKEDAATAQKIRVGFRGVVTPRDMRYFKFFIKETSGEYYNLAMDRFYEAEDDSLWLAFPSSDRNKLDIDTYLILKKGVDSNNVVKDQARYKILAIENEAPDFIKTTYNNIGEIIHAGGNNTSNDDPYGTSMDDTPRSGVSEFSANSAKFAESSLKDINTINDALFVEFQIRGEDYVSNRYEISSITLGTDRYYFKMKNSFPDEVDYFNNGVQVKPNLITRIIRAKVENKAQFEGRFFVKINKDDVFVENISSSLIDENTEYRTTASKKIYLLASDHMDRHNGTSSLSQSSKYGESVYPDSSYGWVTGTTDKWNVPGGNDYIWTDTDEDLTWKWSAFRSYFKPSKTVADVGDELDFYKWEMKNEPANNRHGQIGDRVDEGDLPNWNSSNKYEDVFFIDKAPYLATGRRDWVNQTGPNWDINTDSGNGLGITNWGSGDDSEGRMDLGFGPLEPDNYWDFWNHNNNGRNYWWSWGDGTREGRNSYTKYDSLFKKVTAGHQFRWKEDPTGTIYTVFKSWDQKNRKRYAQHKVSDNDTTIEFGNDHYENGPYFDGSNNTPVVRFNFFPAMTEWEPTNGGGAMNEGIIDGSRIIDKYVLYTAADPSNQVSYDATVTNITGTWDVDNVTISNTQFEHTIDTEYGSSVNDLQASEYNHQKITVGMILTKVGSDAAVGGTTYGVLVKSIDVGETNTVLYFEGYNDVSFTTLALYSASDALVFKQPVMNGLSVNSAANINQGNASNFRGIGAVGYTLEFIEPKEREDLLPEDPAVWETEPKESTDLDIYHEASEYNPITLGIDTIKTALPIGSKVFSTNGSGWGGPAASSLYIEDNESSTGDIITLSIAGCVGQLGSTPGGCTIGGIFVPTLEVGDVLRITRPSGTSFGVSITEIFLDDTNPGIPGAKKFRVSPKLYNSNYWLNWHNCYAFGNGVESNRIRDSFNLPFIANGVIASTTLPEKYNEERRKYGLIYSGIYNSNSGINNLNQFIAAEKITKEVNPIYGSIQKLYSRSTADGDLITLCEDRVLKILANKDAVYNADGNINLTATENVLGQTIPYTGNYGISTNPESFASDAYRAYFCDSSRGSIIRLSQDGLTPISEYGMKSFTKAFLELHNWTSGYGMMIFGSDVFFKGNVKETSETAQQVLNSGGIGNEESFLLNRLVGGFDIDNNEYNFSWLFPFVNILGGGGIRENIKIASNITNQLNQKLSSDIESKPLNFLESIDDGITISFREDVKGWSSFKSFVPESSVSCNGQYYTFKKGEIWEHGFSLRKGPKSFAGSFGGDLFRQTLQDPPVPQTQSDKQYNTFYGKTNFSHISFIFNDLPSSIKDFQALSYEGSQALIIKNSEYNTYSPGTNVVTGSYGDNEYYNLKDKDGWYCQVLATDLEQSTFTKFIKKEGKWFNYIKNYSAQEQITLGGKGSALDYYTNPEFTAHSSFQGLGVIQDKIHNTDIVYGDMLGCTDPNAFNYDSNADADDGSCVDKIEGCMDPRGDNYNPSANTDDGSCVIYGCMDPYGINYDSDVTDDDGSCIYPVLGCTDATIFYSNGIQYYYYFNYDPTANTDDGSCIVTKLGCTDPTATNYDSSANVDDGSCVYDDNTEECRDQNAWPLGDFHSINNGNFDPSTCLFCGESFASNYDGALGCVIKQANGKDILILNGYTFPNTGQDMNIHYCADLNNIKEQSTQWVVWDRGCIQRPDEPDKPDDPSGDLLDFTFSDTSLNTIDVEWSRNQDVSTYEIAIEETININNNSLVFGKIFQVGINNFKNGKYHFKFENLRPDTSYVVGLRTADNILSPNIEQAPNPWSTKKTSTKTEKLGCTDSEAFNYDPFATIDDGSCQYREKSGCTDPYAGNYDPFANFDDGSCEYKGCKDPQAFNYGSTTEDCYYLNPTAGDANGNGFVNLDDLTLIINHWLQQVPYWKNGDVNGDGIVNIFDLMQTMVNWLQTDPPLWTDPQPNSNLIGLKLYQIDNSSSGVNDQFVSSFVNGEKTYRLYAEFNPASNMQDNKVLFVFGNNNNPSSVIARTSNNQPSTFINQIISFIGQSYNFQSNIPSASFGTTEGGALEFDTWVTIGNSYDDNLPPGAVGNVGVGGNLDDVTGWSFGQNNNGNSRTTFTDAAVYRTLSETNLVTPNDTGRILLGQFTISSNDRIDGVMNIFGVGSTGAWVNYELPFSTDDAEGLPNVVNDNHYLYFEGCTDPAANNYNSWSSINDSSCIYPKT